MALGRIGVLREKIAGSSVAVAGPFRQKLRRQDILALLRWTLPSLRSVLGALPERLLVAGAGDPMWRGGLSGPASVFVHAERPLITPDGTSPILHELFHAATGARSIVDGDWVTEGLAELYSVELLMRSRTISKPRYERVLRSIAARGAGAKLLGHGSRGASTARAVTLLRELDAELRARSEQQKTLDDVVAELARKRLAVSTSTFQATAEQVVRPRARRLLPHEGRADPGAEPAVGRHEGDGPFGKRTGSRACSNSVRLPKGPSPS